ncbi:N-acyl homoserine lactonase family protein [Candidatus Bathyarchaeota archaeon]|nr:MAG: N-acyl homoserine lactonase family protein [Candidatus Bathyarchaeota archaeon]
MSNWIIYSLSITRLIRDALTVTEVRLLTDGFFTLDKSFLVFGKYQGTKYKAALKPLLIRTEKENILVDTGIGTLPLKYERFHEVIRTKEEQLRLSLKKTGLEPSDITLVVNTHLHFDHCGNNLLFPNAKFLEQTDEIRYAFFPDRFMRVSYLREFFDLEGEFVPLRGRYTIEDGVEIVPTPGHTIGHQSVIVKWKNRNLVYAGDAAPLPENIEKRNITGMIYNTSQGLESIDLLRRIENPVYIYSHDNEQLRTPA